MKPFNIDDYRVDDDGNAIPDDKPMRTVMKEKGSSLDRNAQRVAEAIVGTPGDIASFLGDIIGSEAGQVVIAESQKLLSPITSQIPTTVKNAFSQYLVDPVKKAGQSLPTSEDLMARSAELFPELDPETEAEQAEGEFWQDVSSLMLSKTRPLRALGIAATGQVGKQAVKQLGGSDTAQEGTKLAGMVLSSMIGKGRGVNRFISRLYRDAESALEGSARVPVNANKLKKSLETIELGLKTTEKSGPRDAIKEILSKIGPDGSVSASELVQLDKDINFFLNQSGLSKNEKYLWNSVKGLLDESLQDLYKQQPRFGSAYTEAKEAFGAVAEGNRMKDYLKKQITPKKAVYTTAALGLMPLNTGLKIGGLTISSVVLGSAWWAKQMATRMAKSPALRRYYGAMLTAAARENPIALARNIEGFERALRASFSDDPIDLSTYLEDDPIE